MTVTMLMINFRLMDGEIAGGADALLVALVGAVLEDIDFLVRWPWFYVLGCYGYFVGSWA